MSKQYYHPSPLRANLLAAIISLTGVSVLYANYDPEPVGADPGELRAGVSAMSVNEPMPVFDIDLPSDSLVDLNQPVDSPVSESADEVKTASADTPTSTISTQPRGLSGRYALLMNILMLEKGVEFLSDIHSYTATFSKVERLEDGELEQQTMSLKVRQQPYSVYMKWITGDKGRELIYVDGANDGSMLVKLGGLKGRLLPTLRLDPFGSRAMAECRHPVTSAGIKEAAQELLRFRRKDLTQHEGVECKMLEDQKFDGRTCFCFMIQYKDRTYCADYRRSIVYLEKEHMMPVQICNYQWLDGAEDMSPEELADASICEDYRYTNLKVGLQFADAEFHKDHESYGFK